MVIPVCNPSIQEAEGKVESQANLGYITVRKEGRKKGGREEKESQAPVAHTCNPSYSGGRDQED
jgi:hypothetical protein